MAIILRLEGLDVKAGPEDIRTFFKSLHIPEGGVYILGGTLREAFIAFSSERDGQLALRNTGSILKGSAVNLYVSSMGELEHKLNTFLRKKKEKSSQVRNKKVEPKPADSLALSGTQLLEDKVANLSPATAWSVDTDTAVVPQLNAQQVYPDTPNVQNMDSNTAFLFGICTVLQGLRSSQTQEINNFVSRDDFLKDQTVSVANKKSADEILDSTPGYARLFGLPATTTKEDICHFFKGLNVLEAIVNVELGLNNGCLVKFASMQEAQDALHFNQHLLGTFSVEVRGGTEKMWNSVQQEHEKENPQHIHWKENQKQLPSSNHETKRKSVNHFPYKPPKKPKLDLNSTAHIPSVEHVVMISNLPKTITKTEIKEFFECPNIPHRNVLHLLDSECQRTDTAFLIFDRSEDYNYALNLSGCHMGSTAIEVSSITKKTMRQMIGQYHSRRIESEQTSLFIRNMPADVERSQILSLFYKYKVRTEDIIILHDRAGNGVGEALVEFKSIKLAELAHRIHGINFLGSKLLLTLITAKQMGDILEKHFDES